MKKKHFHILLLIVMIQLIPAISTAQDSLNVFRVSGVEYWYYATDIIVEGEIAYVSTGISGMRILDISDPSQPVEIGFSQLTNEAYHFSKSGNNLFVSDLEGSFGIVDVSDPANPEAIYRDETLNIVTDIKTIESTAFVASLGGGLTIFDISDLTNPIEIGGVHPAPGYQVAIHENYAVLACGADGFAVIDITDLENPIVLTMLDPDWSTRNVTLVDHYLYCSSSQVFTVYDLQEPDNPQELQTFNIRSASNLVIQDDIGYLPNNHGYVVLDFANMEDIEILGSYYVERRIDDLALSGNSIFLTAGWDDLIILNNADPTDPQPLGRYETYVAEEISIYQDYAYIIDTEHGIAIADISNPNDPVILSFIDLGFEPRGMHIVGDLAYMPGYNDDDAQNFKIFDITNPLELEEVGAVHVNGNLQDVAVQGEYAYIAAYNEGLAIVELSDPTNPVVVGTYDTRTLSYGIDARDNFVYLADGASGMRIIEVSNPINPIEIGRFDTRRYAQDIYLYESYAIIACEGDGMYIVDISDPTNPEEVYHFDTEDWGVSVDMYEHFVFLADREGGVLVFDIEDVENVEITGFYHTHGACLGVLVQPPYLYLAETLSLGIYDCSAAIQTDVQELNFEVELAASRFELVSGPLQPNELTAQSVFGDIAGLVIALSENGDFILPGMFDFQYDAVRGYQIFCDQNTLWDVEGIQIDPENEITLEAGRWNWIGYPFLEEYPATEALSELEEHIEIIMDDDGNLWIPELEINTLETLVPGEGLMVLTYEDFTFQYVLPHEQLVENNTRQPAIAKTPSAYSPTSIVTGKPYAIVVKMDENLWEMNPAVIKVYDEDLLVGQTTVTAGTEHIPVVAWEGSEEYNLCGFTTGNQIKINVLDEQGRLIAETDKTSEMHTFGDGAYAEISLSERKQDGTLPTEFTVENVYPNPFNSTTTLEISLPKSGNVEIVIFNLSGQEIYRKSEFLKPGLSNLSIMMGTDQFPASSGVYLLRASFDNEYNYQKLILMK
ncbi:T9SS type A sorting domain-containing protein [bacterium]|nr:T9SS type A sorting domain-containing protein [bacterium]